MAKQKSPAVSKSASPTPPPADTQPVQESVAPPKPKYRTSRAPQAPAIDFSAEADLGDSSFDPVLDAAPEDRPEALPEGDAPPQPQAEASQPEASSPPRDSSGRFVAKPKHSPRVVRLALELGLSQDEIDSTPPEQLYDDVLLLQRQVLSARQDHRQFDQQYERPAPKPEPEPEIDLGIEDLNPDLAAALKKQFTNQAKEIAALKKQLSEVNERDQVRAKETRDEKIDRFFQEASQYHGVVGKGSIITCDQNEAVRRNAVVMQADQDRSNIPYMQKLANAAKILLTPLIPEAPKPTNGQSYEDEVLAKRRAEWTAAGLQPPTNRKGSSEPFGVPRAAKKLAKKMSEEGMTLDDYADPEEAGLPD